MMNYYFVKRALPGVPMGVLERFTDTRAAVFVLDGSIEPYDKKKHGELPQVEPPKPDAPKETKQAESGKREGRR